MPYNIRTAMQDNTHTAVYDNQKMKMRRQRTGFSSLKQKIAERVYDTTGCFNKAKEICSMAQLLIMADDLTKLMLEDKK